MHHLVPDIVTLLRRPFGTLDGAYIQLSPPDDEHNSARNM